MSQESEGMDVKVRIQLQNKNKNKKFDRIFCAKQKFSINNITVGIPLRLNR